MIRRALVALACSALSVTAMAEVQVEARAGAPTRMYNSGSSAGRASRSMMQAISSSARRPALSIADVDPAVSRHASRLGLDPSLVHAVIRAESAYNPEAVSSKGAAGLMQLMPGTLRDYRVSDPYDPEQNIAAGSAYLKRLLDDFDDTLELALAAYNAGPEAVRRYGGVPPFPETRRYLERVLSAYRPGTPVRFDASLPPGSSAPAPGRKTFVFRDDSGRLVMSTSPPGTR